MVFKGLLKQKCLFAILPGSCCVRSVYFAGQLRQVGGCLSVRAGGGGHRAIAVSVAAAGPGRRQGWGVGGCPVTWCLEVVGGVAEKAPPPPEEGMGYFIHVQCDNSWHFPRRTVSGRRARDALKSGDIPAAICVQLSRGWRKRWRRVLGNLPLKFFRADL
jgi:hypothetical protein